MLKKSIPLAFIRLPCLQRVCCFFMVLAVGVSTVVYAEVPEHNPGLDYQCGPGFQWSRGTVACEQADCPPGAGRTYTYECNCGEAWGKPFRTCYENGLAVKCISAGEECGNTPTGFDPLTGRCTPGFVMEDGVDCIPNPSKEEVACRSIENSQWNPETNTCECSVGFSYTEDKSSCKGEIPLELQSGFQQCSKEEIEEANNAYSLIDSKVQGQMTPDSQNAIVLQEAVDRLDAGLQPKEFNGIAARKSDVPVMTAGPPKEDLELGQSTLTHIDNVVNSVETDEEPEWLKNVPTHAGFFKKFGQALMENAPEEVKNSNDCVKAKYIYGLGLPLLDKKYGYRQLDGSTALGACNVLISKRGFVRIMDSTMFSAFNWMGEMINNMKGRAHRPLKFSPESILYATKQGTCGEWGYGLREIMAAAGIKANVIVAYKKGYGELINHAATEIECKVDGRVEKRVCDAWYLGHDNQRRDLLFSYGRFDNAATSAHNCKPIERWKWEQKLDGKENYFNPDYTGIKDDDFYSSRDIALQDIKNAVNRYIPSALEKKWDLEKVKTIMKTSFSDVYPGEEDVLLAGFLEQYGEGITDPDQKARLDSWIQELRRGGAG